MEKRPHRAELRSFVNRPRNLETDQETNNRLASSGGADIAPAATKPVTAIELGKDS